MGTSFAVVGLMTVAFMTNTFTTKNLLRLVAGASIGAALLVGTSRAQSAERTARNSVFVEGLGPGLMYSVGYERLVTDDFGFRLGVGYVVTHPTVGAEGGSRFSTSFTSLPFAVTWLPLSSGVHSLELDAGITAVYASDAGEVFVYRTSEAGVRGVGSLFVGYRFQPLEGGLQLRAGFMGLAGKGVGLDTNSRKFGVQPWLNLSVGGSFSM